MSSKELTIKLDGLELSDKELAELDSKVQSAVLGYVSGLKHGQNVGFTAGKEAITLGKLNPQWLGIWLKKFININEIKTARFKEIAHSKVLH